MIEHVKPCPDAENFGSVEYRTIGHQDWLPKATCNPQKSRGGKSEWMERNV
jgi:hypothetical protein